MLVCILVQILCTVWYNYLNIFSVSVTCIFLIISNLMSHAVYIWDHWPCTVLQFHFYYLWFTQLCAGVPYQGSVTLKVRIIIDPYHLMFPEIKVHKNTIHVHMYFPVKLFFTIHNNSLLMTLIHLTTVKITIESE